MNIVIRFYDYKLFYYFVWYRIKIKYLPIEISLNILSGTCTGVPQYLYNY